MRVSPLQDVMPYLLATLGLVRSQHIIANSSSVSRARCLPSGAPLAFIRCGTVESPISLQLMRRAE